ncbi:MAG: hypothetical protein K8T20_06040, partial [Planctomycetes bacterium]|nr:hypothetical protein [Planctomycetota bacterium]
MIRSVLVLAALALFLSPVSAGDWDPVADPGINTPANTGLVALREFDSYLYIGTENIGGGARIYRTNDGNTFTAVMTGGFGDGVTRINDFELFGGLLYCATAGPLGGSVYRSPDGLAWTLVSPVGLGSASNAEVTSLSNFSGALYAATRNTGGTGAQLWKSTDGTTWTTSVTTTGFGDVDNSAINDLEVGGGYLYAVTTNASDGGQLVRISSGGGTTVLIDDGFGTTKNKALTALEVFNGQLFIGTENSTDGF